MRLQIFVTGLILAGKVATAQSPNAVPDNVRATNAIDAFTTNTISPGYMLYGINGPSGEIVGDVYLNSDWQNASVKLANREQVFSNIHCKVNLLTNQVEVLNGKQIRAIDNQNIQTITFSNGSRLMNASHYAEGEAALSGFLEILVDGSTPLLKRTSLIVKKPNYNAQLNVGSKDTQLIKVDDLYTIQENKLVILKSVKKKQLPSLFIKPGEVSEYISKLETGKLNEENLKSIFSFGNSLTTAK